MWRGRSWEISVILRVAKTGARPVVLSRRECERLFAALEGTPRLMAELMYGAALRLMELLRLRVKDVDLERRQLIVRAGKGDEDRVTVLPDVGGEIAGASGAVAAVTRGGSGEGLAGCVAAGGTGTEISASRRSNGNGNGSGPRARR